MFTKLIPQSREQAKNCPNTDKNITKYGKKVQNGKTLPQ